MKLPATEEVIPDTVEIHDPRFRQLVLPNAWLMRLFRGSLWAEGPVYFADGDYLLWSDIPNNRMLRWVEGLGVSVFRHPSNHSNGNTRDRQGRLISCEHGTRRLTRTEADGSITVLVDRFGGRRFNSPNDVVVKSDGSIWFSDPTYGIMTSYEGTQAESELEACYVFRFDPGDGSLDIVADDFVKPNGLAFSPDERTLYISDTGVSHDPEGPHHIRAFNVREEKRLSGGRVFAEVSPGASDGFRVDVQGNIWTSAGDGVHCYTAQGVLLGKVKIPETVANLTFGGPKKNRLFIAASTSLYAIYVGISGAQIP